MTFNKTEQIKLLMNDLFDFNCAGIDSKLVTFLKKQNYTPNCKVEDLECENCIYSWLLYKKRESLYSKNSPFKSYKEKVRFFKKFSDYFDIGTGYMMDDENLLSPIPSNLEEEKIYTPIISEFYQNYWNQKRIEGIKESDGCPITSYEDLINVFFEKYSKSPLPEKFLENEKERISSIESNLKGPSSDSFKLEYNSMINSEELIYGHDSLGLPSMRFYLRPLTFPLAKYKIFLEQLNGQLSKNLNHDDELKKIEKRLRKLIIEKLNLDSLKSMKQNINGTIITSIKEKIEREKAINLHGTKKKENNVGYWFQMTDFRELQQIITQKNNWDFFKDTFGNKDNLIKEFSDLINLRNPIRHARELTQPIILKGEGAILWFKEQLNID